jgi:hypothetical protein
MELPIENSIHVCVLGSRLYSPRAYQQPSYGYNQQPSYGYYQQPSYSYYSAGYAYR